jgi:FeS assembly SUF system regulator
MLRISKLTDYAVVLATRMAVHPREETLAVSELAARTHIPEPTARKVLKLLTKGDVVESQRGAQGGYRLRRPAADTTIASVIVAIEGPIGVTECATEEPSGSCEHEGRCDVQGNWRQISAAIFEALSAITLADMAAGDGHLITLGRAAKKFATAGELG